MERDSRSKYENSPKGDSTVRVFKKILSYAACLLTICFIGVGFARVNDELNIFGTVNVRGDAAVVLDTGTAINTALDTNAAGVKKIFFDKYSKYSGKFDKANGIDVSSPDSPENSILLFYDSAASTAYILIDNSDKADIKLTANENSSSMFEDITTLEEICFYNFNTDKCKNTSGMYKNCTALKSIFVLENPDYSKVSTSDEMFTNCTSLAGGAGTRPYPSGTETTEPLDKTYAVIDGGSSNPGYYTFGIELNMPYFVSDLLKETEASYTIVGSSISFDIANYLDSETYATDDLKFILSYYININGEWTLHSATPKTVSGGSPAKITETAAPIVKDGTTYNSVRVTAVGTDGGVTGVTLSAVLNFDYTSTTATHTYSDYVITVTLRTGTDGGQYNFSWISGVIHDLSDENGIFSALPIGATESAVTLESFTTYTFIFPVTDPALATELEGGTKQAGDCVSITR